MKILQALGSAYASVRNKVNYAAATAAVSMLPLTATAGGLDKGKKVLESFNDDLTLILPIVFTIILVLVGIGYSAKVVDKQDAIRWAIGIIIAGSASTLAAAFLT